MATLAGFVRFWQGGLLPNPHELGPPPQASPAISIRHVQAPTTGVLTTPPAQRSRRSVPGRQRADGNTTEHLGQLIFELDRPVSVAAAGVPELMQQGAAERTGL